MWHYLRRSLHSLLTGTRTVLTAVAHLPNFNLTPGSSRNASCYYRFLFGTLGVYLIWTLDFSELGRQGFIVK